MYRRAVELLKLQPEDCIMVASHAYDLRAAKKWSALHFLHNLIQSFTGPSCFDQFYLRMHSLPHAIFPASFLPFILLMKPPRVQISIFP